MSFASTQVVFDSHATGASQRSPLSLQAATPVDWQRDVPSAHTSGRHVSAEQYSVAAQSLSRRHSTQWVAGMSQSKPSGVQSLSESHSFSHLLWAEQVSSSLQSALVRQSTHRSRVVSHTCPPEHPSELVQAVYGTHALAKQSLSSGQSASVEHSTHSSSDGSQMVLLEGSFAQSRLFSHLVGALH